METVQEVEMAFPACSHPLSLCRLSQNGWPLPSGTPHRIGWRGESRVKRDGQGGHGGHGTGDAVRSPGDLSDLSEVGQSRCDRL